jgi:hypothetical protein
MTHPAAVLDRAGLDRLVAVLIAQGYLVVDAALCDPSTPGRIHRTTLGDAYPAGSRRARTASASRTRSAARPLGSSCSRSRQPISTSARACPSRSRTRCPN